MGNYEDWPKRATGVTWNDLGKATPELCWQYIRSLRSSPPGFASKGPRAAKLKAALNQSEQLFNAARGVDYSARPLLAYYGLAQAALAIIQASPRIVNSASMPGSHGMTWEIQGPDLAVSQDGNKGLLGRLLSATNSGNIATCSDLGKLWSFLPERDRNLVRGTDRNLSPWQLDSPSKGRSEITISIRDGDLLREDFAATLGSLISARPCIRSLQLLSPPQGVRWNSPNEHGGFTLYAHVDVDVLNTSLADINGYYDSRISLIYAPMAGENTAAHPLAIWLSILFLLSMVARYRSDQWVAMLDVDKSEDGAMFEEILQRASEVCPGLILNTLDHMGVLYKRGVRPAARL